MMKPGQSNTGLTRSQAIRLVAEADRPVTVLPSEWIYVHVVLLQIARHYPNSYPSEQTMATALGRSVPTIQRYIRMAVNAGLLERYQRSVWQSRYGSNAYRIKYHHRASSMMLGPAITHDGLTSTDTHVSVPKDSEALRASESSNNGNHRRPPAAISETPPRKIAMSDYDQSFYEGASESERSDLRESVSPPSLKRKRSPVGEVTAYLREEWDKRLLKPGGTSLSVIVVFDSVAAFQSRIKQDCFQREGHTVAEVCASLDAFLQQIDVGRVLPKPGQPLWKLWWSTRAKYPMKVYDRSGYHVTTHDDLRREVEAARRANRLDESEA